MSGEHGIVRVSDSHDALIQDTARMFQETAIASVRDHSRADVVLSGGSTPLSLYQLLAAPEFAASIPWENVHVWFGDERCVPPDHEQSNYLMAYESLLSHVPVLPQRIHRMKGELNPSDAAAEYEAEIRSELPFKNGMPVFDFNLLGVGPDGHTASLFPGTAALREETKVVIGHFVPNVNMNRITLTFPAINNSAVIAFLVSGADKADIMAHIFRAPEPGQAPYPSQMVQAAHGKLYWLLDAPSAAKLPQA